MKFKELKIGDVFDFINDEKPGYNSYFKRVRKVDEKYEELFPNALERLFKSLEGL